MSKLQKITSIINDLREDIKAEAIIADIIDNGVKDYEVVVQMNGGFKRRFKRDLSYSEVKQLNNGEDVLSVFLNRDGIYDTLPEGLFHEPPAETSNRGSEMAHQSKKQKNEEKQARRFFMPFENELFLQRVAIELEERSILKHYSESLFDEIYPQFWNLDKSLPEKFVSRMILILHFAHKIVGFPDRIARILEIILEEQVTVTKSWGEYGTDSNANLLSVLGQGKLGVDFVLSRDKVWGPTLKFEIGPLKNTSLENYLDKGSIAYFLECFYKFFVPMEYTAISTINIPKEATSFALEDDRSTTILGYNTAI